MARGNRAKTRASSKPSPSSSRSSTPASTSSSALNEGQRRLLAVRDSLATIAMNVGCSKALAGFWRQGKNVPAAKFRAVLERDYGIPARAWDLAPGELDDEEGDDGDEDERSAAVVDYGTLAEVMDQIRTIKRELERDGLTDAVRARKGDTLVKLLKLKAQIERDELAATDRFVRGPKWARFRTELRDIVADVAPEKLDRLAQLFERTEAS